ncbi:MAG: four helix bundle protein [Phycisphaerales bacterium]|nr:four helix bundle protein [Phycisphaerales bacterium]
MKDFRKLDVWQKAHALVVAIYKASTSFPKEELYGLTSQLRRSAVSVPSNLAEGCGRGSDADLARFVQMAMGSASEMEYQLLVIHDLGYVATQVYDTLNSAVCEIKRMLAGLLQKLKAER